MGAQLRQVGSWLLVGVALGGTAAAGGYALGAAAHSRPRLPAIACPPTAPSDETLQVLHQIEGRLARLETRTTAAAPALSQGSPTPAPAKEEPAVAAPHHEDPIDQLAQDSDPDLLLSSQRLIENVLATRSVSPANKMALRDALPKLSMNDRMAAMNELSAALNRGEIEFDARELF